MKAFIVIATCLIAQATLANCGDNNDYYSDCAYMWMMMMNSGPQVTGLGLWLLVGVGLTALLLSMDIPSMGRRDAI